MSGAAGGGGGSSCLGAAAAASCSSAGSPYAAAAGGGAGVAGRLPARVLEHVFSYLELSDLMRCSLVCWHWNNILADENSEVWRSLCNRSLSDEAMRSDILCNLPTYKGKVGFIRRAAVLSGWTKLHSKISLFSTFALPTPGGWNTVSPNESIRYDSVCRKTYESFVNKYKAMCK